MSSCVDKSILGAPVGAGERMKMFIVDLVIWMLWKKPEHFLL